MKLTLIYSVRPKFKVDIARDAGLTNGSRNKNAYFCLFFAKGMCSQGPKCNMWHRVPTTEDKLETTIDCFGRDKFTEFRQDMGGVGGFIRENRTLYVGRIAISSDTENVIRRQFGQFGPLERGIFFKKLESLERILFSNCIYPILFLNS